MENTSPEISSPEAAAFPKFPWRIMAVIQIGIALLALLGSLTKVETLAIGSALFGGGVGGIVCGVMAGGRIGKTPGSKVAIGILFAILFFCLSLGLCFFGCMLSGFSGGF